MSRKDYVKVAAILAAVEDYEERRRLAHEFAYMFQEDNTFFDRERFLTASGVDVW